MIKKNVGLLVNFIKDRKGIAVEYGALLGIVAVAVILSLGGVKDVLNDVFASVIDQIAEFNGPI